MIEEMEKEKRRNIRLKISDMSNLLYHMFSPDGEGMEINMENVEEVSAKIMSEIFGHNTIDLDTPVDVETCKIADDIIAQIKSKRSLPSKRKGQFVNMNHMKRLISKKVSMGITTPDLKNTTFDKIEIEPVDSIDPFDAAMDILEKK